MTLGGGGWGAGPPSLQAPPGSSSGTHHAVVVDQLQLVVRQDVGPVVDQVQGHLGRGQARLAPRPAPAHGEQGSDVQLLLPCGRRRPEEEKEGQRGPEEPVPRTGG